MSMYFTANKIFGLLLTDDEIVDFQKEYCRKNKEYLLNEYKDETQDLIGAEEEVLLEELAYLVSDNFSWSEDMFVDQDAREKPLHTYIINSDNAEGMVFRPIAIAHDNSVTDKTLSEGMIIPAKMGYSEIAASFLHDHGQGIPGRGFSFVCV